LIFCAWDVCKIAASADAILQADGASALSNLLALRSGFVRDLDVAKACGVNC